MEEKKIIEELKAVGEPHMDNKDLEGTDLQWTNKG